jgi:membrane protease YdiL (CAAX protease family)
MLGAFIFQGAFEEVLCRGIVQQLLQKKSIPVAVGVSTALFTIPHIGNMDFSAPAIAVTAVINLILISVIFSLLTIRFKSIWAACGLHSIWNYILYSILGLNLSGNDEINAAVFDMSSVGDNILNGGKYGIEASIITTAVLGAAAIALIVFNIRKPERG